MKLVISKVDLTKEIDWAIAQSRDNLYVDMMRNRVTLHGSSRILEDESYQELWYAISKDIRKFCNEKNIGLFAIESTVKPLIGMTVMPSHSKHVHIDAAEGQMTIYFEDAGDYARFLKDKAVMFKLSINTQ